jgi:hypothetical protein
MNIKYRYPSSLSPSKSFEDQLQGMPYAGNDLSPTVEHTKQVSRKHEVGSGGAHALLAAGSKQEQKAIARVLNRLQPLRLYDVETTQEKENPKRTVLFGIARKATPVVMCLQAKRPYKDTDRGGCDLFITGIYPHLKHGVCTLRPRVFEFDFFPDHRTPSGRIDDQYRNMRSRWEGAEVIPIRDEPDGTDWRRVTEREIFEYKGHLETQIQSRLAEKQAVIQLIDEEVEEDLSDADLSKSVLIGQDLPKKNAEDLFITRRSNLDPEKFQDSLRDHCKSCYNLKRYYRSGEHTGEVRIRVTRNKISINQVLLGPQDEGGWPEDLRD